MARMYPEHFPAITNEDELERAVVILTEMHRANPTTADQLHYAAYSRARNHIVILRQDELS